MDDVTLPFTMTASVSSGGAAPDAPLPEQLPPGWVRIPVTIEVMLPPEVADRLRAAEEAGPGAARPKGRADGSYG